MSGESYSNGSNGDELHRLFSAWCDEVISAPDQERLQAMLLADPQARLDFISYMGVHGGIKTEIIGHEHFENFAASPDGKKTAAGQPSDRAVPQLLKFQRLIGLGSGRLRW